MSVPATTINQEAIQADILKLVQLEKEQTMALRKAGNNLVTSITPSPLVKKIISGLGKAKLPLKSAVASGLISGAIGTFARRILVGRSKNIFRGAAGLAVDMAISSYIKKRLKKAAATGANDGEDVPSAG